MSSTPLLGLRPKSPSPSNDGKHKTLLLWIPDPTIGSTPAHTLVPFPSYSIGRRGRETRLGNHVQALGPFRSSCSLSSCLLADQSAGSITSCKRFLVQCGVDAMETEHISHGHGHCLGNGRARPSNRDWFALHVKAVCRVILYPTPTTRTATSLHHRHHHSLPQISQWDKSDSDLELAYVARASPVRSGSHMVPAPLLFRYWKAHI